MRQKFDLLGIFNKLCPLAFLPLGLAILAGCAGSHDQDFLGNSQEAPPETTLNHLSIQLSDSGHSLSDDENTLVTKVNQHEPIPFELITRVTLLQNLKRLDGNDVIFDGNPRVDAITAIARASAGVSRSDLKLTYEQKLYDINHRQLTYDSAATNLFHPLTRNALQCYSGTLFHEVIIRQALGARGFKDQNRVVIHENGHVLPGFMVKDIEGVWHLYGVETTFEGRGLIHYGKAPYLNGPIRVVDANEFLAIEALKNIIANPREVALAALQSAAALYGIDLARTEIGVPPVRSRVSRPRNLATNATLFSFGTAPAGRHNRNVMDHQSRSASAFVEPEELQTPAAEAAAVFQNYGAAENEFGVILSAPFALTINGGISVWQQANEQCLRVSRRPKVFQNTYEYESYQGHFQILSSSEFLLTFVSQMQEWRDAAAEVPMPFINNRRVSEGSRRRTTVTVRTACHVGY